MQDITLYYSVQESISVNFFTHVCRIQYGGDEKNSFIFDGEVNFRHLGVQRKGFQCAFCLHTPLACEWFGRFAYLELVKCSGSVQMAIECVLNKITLKAKTHD